MSSQTHTQRPGSPPNPRAELPEETSSLPRDKREKGEGRKEVGELPRSLVSNSPLKAPQAQALGPRVQDPGQTEASMHGLQGGEQRFQHSCLPNPMMAATELTEPTA